MSRLEDPPAGQELDTDEAKRLVLEELAGLSSNVAVAFSGGEHLLRPDAYDLLAHAAGLGICSFINTNGKLLVETDAVRRALRATEGRVIFALPLNSVDLEVNRASRDDDLSTVMRAVEICRREGAEHFFLLTISKENLSTLDKTMEFLKTRGVPVLRAPFVPRGAGRQFADLLFDAEDMREKIHPALTENPLSYISFTPFFASPETKAMIWRQFDIRIEGLGCQAARSFAAVNAEGDVAPCVQLLDSRCVRGNVREKPLSEIILEDPMFTALRSRAELKGKCGSCRYRDTCGGCRALAYYHSGDVLGEDPTCFFEPENEETHSDLEEMQTAQLVKFLLFLKDKEPWNTLF